MVVSFIENDPELALSFMTAARKGDVSKVAEMVEAGMPVDITDEVGWTALITAAINNRTDVVRCLLDKGANVNKQDRDVAILHRNSKWYWLDFAQIGGNENVP